VLSHDDAETAVLAAMNIPAGIYNVVDDEPLTRQEYVDSLASLLGVAPARLIPGWVTGLLGNTVELLARSQRISNDQLKAASGWRPRYPSTREGWRVVLDQVKENRQAISPA